MKTQILKATVLSLIMPELASLPQLAKVVQSNYFLQQLMKRKTTIPILITLFTLVMVPRVNGGDGATSSIVDNISFSGNLSSTQSTFIIQGIIKGLLPQEKEPPLIFISHSIAQLNISPTNAMQKIECNIKILQGALKELVFEIRGDGEIANVNGDWIEYWGFRYDTKGSRYLILKAKEQTTKSTPTAVSFSVTTSNKIDQLPCKFSPIAMYPTNSALFDGELEIKYDSGLELSFTNLTGLSMITVQAENKPTPQEYFKFRFSGTQYGLTLEAKEKDPDTRKVEFKNFNLVGELKERSALFTLQGEAVVRHRLGGRLMLLGGNSALTAIPTNLNVKFESNRYWLIFTNDGVYPVTIKFGAKVTEEDGWNIADFEVAPSVLRPLVLKGLGMEAQLQINGAKAERQGKDFAAYALSDGNIRLRWKEVKPEEIGKLFFSVDGVVQIGVSAGLMRQLYVLEYKILQGELTQLEFDLTGEGEVTRVRGDDILNWRVEEIKETNQRKVIVQLNQPKKDKYSFAIQAQTPLSAFPLTIKPMRLTPLNAIRYGGSLQVVNDGAIKLEIQEARGLSQISPELFPSIKEVADLGIAQFTQAFAYRFSGTDYSLTIQADHILPELTVSEVLLYFIGETETAIEAELEIDIREAPLREFQIRVPPGYSVSRLNIQSLADYFLTPAQDGKSAQLRAVFSQPLSGRQIMQVRLEKNQPAGTGVYNLPKIQPLGVKTVRGNIGVSTETGFRATTSAIIGLTEIAPAYFPKKVAGLQLSWRIREENWDATINIERLALAIQADTVNIFTITEGNAYGSSIINFFITGTPVSSFKINVPDEYANVEFTGRDIRNWKKVGNAYEVYLHSPVFGTYTLLATYDRKFDSKSNLVSCVGVSPIDVQSDRGTIIIVSDYQFGVQPVKVSPGVIQLDPAEVPPDQRLLFTAPIIDAYQYSSRPFELSLQFTSFILGQTTRQVVDRALLETRISSEGELVTTGKYYLKTHGYSHFRFECPPEIQLWEARINDQKIIPVADGKQTLIPLPPKAGPLLFVDLKWASKSQDKTRIKLITPVLSVPVLLTEWQIRPDTNYTLKYLGGTVEPKNPQKYYTGFQQIKMLITGKIVNSGLLWLTLIGLLVSILFMFLETRISEQKFVTKIILSLLCLFTTIITLIFMYFLFRTFASIGTSPAVSNEPLTFLAPVQDAGKPIFIELENINLLKRMFSIINILPAIAGIALFIYGWIKDLQGLNKKLCLTGGWFLLFLSTLISTNGLYYGIIILIAMVFIHLVIPFIKSQTFAVKRFKQTPQPPAETVTTALLIGIIAISSGLTQTAYCAKPAPENTVVSIRQEGRVQDGFIFVKSTMKWSATTGAAIDLLIQPAVLTAVEYPQQSVSLSVYTIDGKTVNRITAKENGEFNIIFSYQIAYKKEGAISSFVVPAPAGLVNQFNLELDRAEQEIFSPDAVSIETGKTKRGDAEVTTAIIMLEPKQGAAVGWRPRQRDTRAEKPLFYAEFYHLLIPMPGVLETINDAQIRVAQGQLDELILNIPMPITITDVQADFVSSWKFDPDKRTLRVQFKSPQSRPFNLRIRSQIVTSSLPYSVTNNIMTLQNAAGQVGMVGIASGNEVQLDAVKEQNLSVINLEDFPAVMMAELSRQISGLTLRRAFRYSQDNAGIIITVSAVQPDVRTQSQETLSLSEDRVVLASLINFTVSRAGIFKLSFVLPADYEVESISGDVLSHWTEMKSTDGRITTAHMRGKTEGSHTLNITLVGPGIGNKKEFEAPRLVIREAEKHTGQLVIVPELGMRLHTTTRDGLTQLDPLKAGIKQKGVLAFRILHQNWRLMADIESVEPWIQVNSLLDVLIREGMVINTVSLDYQIENAGVKSLKLKLPSEAENVRFEGDLISDTVKSAQKTGNFTEWDVKLQRRVIGNYPLKIYYQIPFTNRQDVRISGVKAMDANLQRGYLAIRAGGRLELKIPSLPSSLQPAEWESIPMSLRRSRDLTESKDTFSALENDFELNINIARHEIAKVMPARIEEITLTSVIAPFGEMLTEGKLLIHPGDKRLLRISLPESSKFWYAFVNDQSAMPWQDKDQILIMLEKNADPTKPTTIEFFYSSIAYTEGGKFNQNLKGPSFDLPLQNVKWTVYFPEVWELKKWESSLQLVSTTDKIVPVKTDVAVYLQSEMARLRQKSKEAENLLLTGNTLVQQGAPQQAKRAFQAAYKMSEQDAALNEDARVQLHNLKLQQALIGLNQRRQSAFESMDKQKPSAQMFSQWAPGQEPDYTQQQAKQLLEQNTAEENIALTRLAERLIRQQDAAIGKPAAVRPALPAFGRELVFSVPLKIQPWAELSIKLKTAHRTMFTDAGLNLAIIGGIIILIALLVFSSTTGKSENK